jgi:hypothetical protein
MRFPPALPIDKSAFSLFQMNGNNQAQLDYAEASAGCGVTGNPPKSKNSESVAR